MKSRLYGPGLHQSFPSHQWRMVFAVMGTAWIILRPCAAEWALGLAANSRPSPQPYCSQALCLRWQAAGRPCFNVDQPPPADRPHVHGAATRA